MSNPYMTVMKNPLIKIMILRRVGLPVLVETTQKLLPHQSISDIHNILFIVRQILQKIEGDRDYFLMHVRNDHVPYVKEVLREYDLGYTIRGFSSSIYGSQVIEICH